MKLYAYNEHSESAKALSAALGIKRIKHEGKALKVPLLLNWGASRIERNILCQKVLNSTASVGRAVNKLTAFGLLGATVAIPDFTTDKGVANLWLMEGNGPIVCRTKLTGHSGEGIVIAAIAGELEEAPLYVKYIKKTQEYRLHVMHNEVFFVQRKARKMDVPDEAVNWQVRNLAGGFIYANQDVEVGEQAKIEAVAAIMALGLDFGAVDVIYNQEERKYYVLEVNTACGLTGTTLDKYVEQFKRYV